MVHPVVRVLCRDDIVKGGSFPDPRCRPCIKEGRSRACNLVFPVFEKSFWCTWTIVAGVGFIWMVFHK
eukprot:200217-Lingulodinium_polyedra.AAC.1